MAQLDMELTYNEKKFITLEATRLYNKLMYTAPELMLETIEQYMETTTWAILNDREEERWRSENCK